MSEVEPRSKIEALAQRGLSAKQIMFALKLDVFTAEDLEAIDRGRASGVVLLNNKLFDQAIAGDKEAIKVIMTGYLEEPAETESYVDRQLRIIENLHNSEHIC